MCKVFVYFNLHKRTWSVKALEGPNKGRVVLHTDKIKLVDCTFKVSETGRQRVIRERRKNVHAGVVGTMVRYTDKVIDSVEVTYNPYLYSTFVEKTSLTTCTNAKTVWMENKRVYKVN